MCVNYRAFTEQCIREAEKAALPEVKSLFFDMAECSSRLAAQSDTMERLADRSWPPAKWEPAEASPTWVRPRANVVDITWWRKLHPRNAAPTVASRL